MQVIRFIKDWTLPVAIGTGIIVYLIFALVPALDGFATAAEPVFDTMLPTFMFLVLFVTFCKVDFHKLRPRGLALVDRRVSGADSCGSSGSDNGVSSCWRQPYTCRSRAHLHHLPVCFGSRRCHPEAWWQP